MYWALLGLGLLLAAAVVCVPMIYVRTPYYTRQNRGAEQPVPFDHRHHVRDDGIDCLYCHSAAESSASASVPAADVCMGCHAQVWIDSPLLEPVRQAFYTGEPIHWKRVHLLPDHVYFHHGVHVQAGIDCAHCHGDVSGMAQVYQAQPLTMGWCLDCHREPQAALDASARELGFGSVQLAAAVPSGRQINRLTNCTACHR